MKTFLFSALFTCVLVDQLYILILYRQRNSTTFNAILTFFDDETFVFKIFEKNYFFLGIFFCIPIFQLSLIDVFDAPQHCKYAIDSVVSRFAHFSIVLSHEIKRDKMPFSLKHSFFCLVRTKHDFFFAYSHQLAQFRSNGSFYAYFLFRFILSIVQSPHIVQESRTRPKGFQK